jgi:hypothetical protein
MCWRFGHQYNIIEVFLMEFRLLMLFEMSHVYFGEDPLQGNIVIVVLIDDICVGLLEIIIDIPYMNV